MRENWEKETLLGEFFDRVKLINSTLFILALAVIAYAIFYVSSDPYFAVFVTLLFGLLLIVGKINEVAHDMPREGFRPFRSRLHTIIWRISQRGSVALACSVGVFALRLDETDYLPVLWGFLLILLAYTWVDLFSYWWNDRAPETPRNGPRKQAHRAKLEAEARAKLAGGRAQ